jgi:plasmid stabilization system protein ParE
MSIELHPAAERDLEEAAAFYAGEGSPALAARFLAEFERVARMLHSNPGLGTPRTRGRRGFPTTDSPTPSSTASGQQASAFWWSNTIDGTLAMAVPVNELTFPG